jgi:outer membrane protein assembly factor BamB
MRAVITLLAMGFAPAALAAEPPAWPQFRGPAGSGVAAEGSRPPIRVSPHANVKWKAAVPPGASSPVIAGDRLFLTGFEAGKLLTLAYRLDDGVELWRKEAPTKKVEPFVKEGSPAASTSATDGERLVTYFGSYGLICYDTSGKELWKYPLPAGETYFGFGTGSSPVLADGRVVLLRDLERSGRLLCLDLTTGARVWEANRDGYRTSWGSACIWDTPAGKQVVVVGGLRLQGYDLKSGAVVWTVNGLPSQPCTTPVVADGKLVYAGWSYGGTSENQIPSFDDLLKQAGEEALGYLTQAGSEKTVLKGYFDSIDHNKDGKLTREEWDTQFKFQASGKNVAFALSPGGTSDVTHSHVAWTVTKKGLPYIPSPLVYRGRMHTVTKEGRLSAFDVKTGKESLCRGAGWAERGVRQPGGRKRAHLFVRSRWIGDRDTGGGHAGEGVVGQAGRPDRSHPGNRRQHHLYPHQQEPVCIRGGKVTTIPPNEGPAYCPGAWGGVRGVSDPVGPHIIRQRGPLPTPVRRRVHLQATRTSEPTPSRASVEASGTVSAENVTSRMLVNERTPMSKGMFMNW